MNEKNMMRRLENFMHPNNIILTDSEIDSTKDWT